MTYLIVAVVGLLLVALALWMRHRAAQIKEQEKRREIEAMAALTSESSFLQPPKMEPAVEVVDIDALLSGERPEVAAAARAQLDAPTNIGIPQTLPPRPIAAVVPPAFAKVGAQRQDAAAANAPTAQPARPVLAVSQRARAPSPALEVDSGIERDSQSNTPVTIVAGVRQAPGTEVPLRELTLAWFEARGYRPAPASTAVRPIELVLRHRHDPSRAYAFVVDRERVTPERALALLAEARAIGLMRLLIAAEGGAAIVALEALRKKGVRVVDRKSMDAEFAKLEITVAAKIIAVARGRTRPRLARTGLA